MITLQYLQGIIKPNPQTITVPTQKVVWPVIAKNNGTAGVLSGVKVACVFSDPNIIVHRTSASDNALGVANGSTSAFGTFYDTATGLWNVGSLAVGIENAKVLFIETSLPSGTNLLTALPITLTMTISIDGVADSDLGNNEIVYTLGAPMVDISCAPVAGPVSGSCRCSVATNDTPCNYGQTRWSLKLDSLVNVDLTMLDFDS